MVGVANLELPSPWNSTSAQTRWAQIVNQIQAEAPIIGEQNVDNQIAAAQSQFVSTLTDAINSNVVGSIKGAGNYIAGVAQPLNSSFDTLAAAAQSSTLTGIVGSSVNTVYGAVQMVQGAVADFNEIAQGFETGNPQEIEAGVQALVGTIVTVLAAAGVATGGIGLAVAAVIGAAIEIGVDVLSAFHLIGGATGTKIGDGTCSGQGFTSSQGTTGGVVALPALTWGILNPGANGEGVCVWGSLIAPGANNWRSFPSPNNPNDAEWFQITTETTIYWPSGPAQAKWYTKNDGNWRPIDNAFHRYRWLECEAQLGYMLSNGGGEGVSTSNLDAETGAAVTQFLAAYFAMWKRNAELALNGLQPAADSIVLQQLLVAWNTAHAPGKTFTFKAYSGCSNSYNCFPPGSAGQGTDCQDVTGGYSYVSLLVADLSNSSSGMLTINPGPQYAPPMALTVPTTPLGTKLLLGGSAALLLGAAGAAGYGLYTGQGAGYAFGLAGDAIAGAASRLGGFAGEALAAVPGRRGSMKIQSLLFPRGQFTRGEAIAWARRHGFRADKTDTTDRYIRIRQRSPGDFKTERTISLGDSGVRAVVGR